MRGRNHHCPPSAIAPPKHTKHHPPRSKRRNGYGGSTGHRRSVNCHPGHTQTGREEPPNARTQKHENLRGGRIERDTKTARRDKKLRTNKNPDVRPRRPVSMNQTTMRITSRAPAPAAICVPTGPASKDKQLAGRTYVRRRKSPV